MIAQTHRGSLSSLATGTDSKWEYYQMKYKHENFITLFSLYRRKVH